MRIEDFNLEKLVPCCTIKCWDDFDDLFRDCGLIVFRGQSNASWELKTNYQREFDRNVAMESSMLKRCISEGHLFVENPPNVDDVVSWLAEMQHFGASTRLLDVTRSKYIALFFAIKENLDKDGAVWAFNTSQADFFLYERIIDKVPCIKIDQPKEGFGSGIMPYQDIGWKIAEAAIKCEPAGRITKINDELRKCQSLINKYYKQGMVVHLVPKRLNKRLLAQQGEFLFPLNIQKSFVQNLLGAIGGSDYKGDLCDFGDSTVRNRAKKTVSPNVIKCIIPLSLKKEFIMERLLEMNISYLTLFPDEEGFMKSLKFQKSRKCLKLTSRHGNNHEVIVSQNEFDL